MDEEAWQKIEELMRKPQLAKDLIARAQKQFASSSHVAEIKRIKARMSGYSSQLEALTERELKRCDEVLLRAPLLFMSKTPGQAATGSKSLNQLRAFYGRNRVGF